MGRPLLSVVQMIQEIGRAPLSNKGSYVDDPSGEQRSMLEEQGDLFLMKVWVPRDQEPFQGQV